jgi:hypothetical protein
MSGVIVVLVLFPLLLLVDSRLAFIALGAAIVWMVVNKTRVSSPPRRRTSEEQPQYKAGYEN